MDFYYRKLMGNGTITSKFKLNANRTTSNTVIHLNQSNIREPVEVEVADETESLVTPSTNSTNMKNVEFPDTHHPYNCDRCYKLKKKCLRLYPQCENCTKAGASCEYIDRSNKRRKKTNITFDGDKIELGSLNESPTFHTVNEKNDNSKPKGKGDDLVLAHKLVSVSSLLSDESAGKASEKAKEIRSRYKKQIVHPGNNKNVHREQTISEKLALKSLNQQHLKTNLKEEFITMKAMDNELALYFVLNYFHNYGTDYPFINRDKFMEEFKKINFEQEMIINLDVYLLMSIGCITYDYNNSTSLFDEYFNDKTIGSIIDILNFGRNNNEEEDFGNLTLLMLLTIYAIKVFHAELCWGLTGIIDRLLIDLGLYKPKTQDENQQKRIFWSAFNLDNELNLLLHKPSQLPNYDYIKLETPLSDSFTRDEPGDMITKTIDLHKLQHRILDLKLRENNDGIAVKQLSQDLETWRVSTSLVIHNTHVTDSNFQDYISLVNLNYYYLLIELDQLSPSESFQFTLQFLSNSFTLLISEPTSTSKPQISISVNTLFWYTKLFNVIKYNISSLIELLKLICNNGIDKPDSSGDLTLKLSDFNSNLQLMLNLLKYLSQNKVKQHPCISKVNTCIEILSGLNVKLLHFNAFSCPHEDKLSLLRELGSIKCKLEASI